MTAATLRTAVPCVGNWSRQAQRDLWDREPANRFVHHRIRPFPFPRLGVAMSRAHFRREFLAWRFPGLTLSALELWLELAASFRHGLLPRVIVAGHLARGKYPCREGGTRARRAAAEPVTRPVAGDSILDELGRGRLRPGPRSRH